MPKLKYPSAIWVIFDSYLDGPFVFKSKREAKQMLKKWAKSSPDMGIEGMSEPIRFERVSS